MTRSIRSLAGLLVAVSLAIVACTTAATRPPAPAVAVPPTVATSQLARARCIPHRRGWQDAVHPHEGHGERVDLRRRLRHELAAAYGPRRPGRPRLPAVGGTFSTFARAEGPPRSPTTGCRSTTSPATRPATRTARAQAASGSWPRPPVAAPGRQPGGRQPISRRRPRAATDVPLAGPRPRCRPRGRPRARATLGQVERPRRRANLAEELHPPDDPARPRRHDRRRSDDRHAPPRHLGRGPGPGPGRPASGGGRHGPTTFGLFSCSKATNEVNFAAQKFSRTVLGSNNLDSCNRT